jgi:hypothetical protein
MTKSTGVVKREDVGRLILKELIVFL